MHGLDVYKKHGAFPVKGYITLELKNLSVFLYCFTIFRGENDILKHFFAILEYCQIFEVVLYYKMISSNMVYCRRYTLKMNKIEVCSINIL